MKKPFIRSQANLAILVTLWVINMAVIVAGFVTSGVHPFLFINGMAFISLSNSIYQWYLSNRQGD